MREKKLKLSINVPMEITTTDISGLICNAIEGGSNYWYSSLKYDFVKYELWCDHLEAYLNKEEPRPISIRCSEIENDPKPKMVYLTTDRIKWALENFHDFAPRQAKDFFKDVAAEELGNRSDSETGDCFLQGIVFQKVIYG